jgi:3-deoxy-D-manno-octulosonic-acid transferase
MNALDLFYVALAGVTSPFWMRKARSGWGERLGRVEPLGEARVGGRNRVLIHAVSVGEVSALRELVPRLVDEVEVVISVTTDTGTAHARKVFGETCHVVRYPLDFSWSVRRFLDVVQPDVVGLVELEIWPNFVRACDRRGVPVCVINGRLSARSFRGYRRIRRWIGPSFRRLAFAAVQDEAYAERFRAMGVAAEACTVTGSMKWDASRIEEEVEGSDELARAMGIDRGRPLVVAGSTGPGEEAMLHEACPAGVQLLCAPRKPERFEEAAAALPGCVRRSVGEAAGAAASGADRFLLDTLGELRRAYALADVVVVGRSFGDLYGSDPIEPVSLGKAVVIGPRHSDFGVIVAALEDVGGIEVCEAGGLGGLLGDLLADPARREGLAVRGRACIVERQGASERHGRMLIGACSGGGRVVS